MAAGRIIFRRWLNLFVYSIVAALVFFLLMQFISEYFPNSIITSDRLWILRTLLVFFLLLSLLNIGLFRWKDFSSKKTFRYPPVWYSGILGFIFYFLLLNSFEKYSLAAILITLESKEFYLSVIPGLIGVICALLVFSFNKNNQKDGKMSDAESAHRSNNLSLNKSDNIFEDDEALVSWIMSETPIEKPQLDFLNFRSKAHKLANKLENEAIRSIAIIGPYGVGKSSFLNLLECEYKHLSPNMKICRIDGWGYDKKVIAQQVLEEIIGQLSKYTDCLSIMSIPSSYVEALTESKTFFSFLFHLIPNEFSPVKILKSLDEILEVNDQKIMLLIEDLDRNSNSNEMLNEIASFLDRIRLSNNISFAIAVGNDFYEQEIFNRICEHIEYLR